MFVEGIDTFALAGNEVTLHSSSVFEIDAQQKIARRRDYWDTREVETQRT